MISAYLIDTATVIVEVRDQWGTITAPTSLDIKCRIEYANKLVQTITGTQAMSTTQLLVGTSIGGQLLPGMTIEVDSVRHTILSRRLQKDFIGRYWEIYLE